MTVEDINKAQSLMGVLIEGLETQQEILDGLRDILNDHLEFLRKELEILNG